MGEQLTGHLRNFQENRSQLSLFSMLAGVPSQKQQLKTAAFPLRPTSAQKAQIASHFSTESSNLSSEVRQPVEFVRVNTPDR
jgi:hypothetical protein